MEINLNFERANGIIPAVVQDSITNKVLLLGYMNKEAYEKTIREQIVSLYNENNKSFWIKEENVHFEVVEIIPGSDGEAILVKVKPRKPVDHKGEDNCLHEKNNDEVLFLNYLQNLICGRKIEMPAGSYTTKLFQSGINKIAQKVGEEAVELIIEAKDANDELFLNEAADLIYHFLVMLAAKNYRIEDVISILRQRHQ